MRLLHKNQSVRIRNLFLIAFCMVSGTTALFAEGKPDLPAEVLPQTPPPRTLRPVDTGRSVTFQIGRSNGRGSRSGGGSYDRFAVKTNLLYDATLTPNLSLEFGVGPRTTVEIGGAYNPWEKKLENGTIDPDAKKWNHWLGKAEFRYWLGERFDRHFAGVQAFYADYNVGLIEIPMIFKKEFLYDGTVFGGSVLYGYHWRPGERLFFEFTLGVGVMQMKYSRMEHTARTEDPPRFNKTYFGPTTAGIKLGFMIK